MNKKIGSNIIPTLEQKHIAYKLDLPVAEKSSFKIGGKVALALFPVNADQLVECVRLLKKEDIKFQLIGNASNLLFAFDYYQGAFIFTSETSALTLDKNRIICEVGVPLTRLSNVAAQNSLGGMEFAFGIPALVGGAVYMNAGAYGSQIADVIEYTVAYDMETDSIKKIYDNDFGYRISIYEKNPNLICLGASFVLHERDSDEIKNKMAQNMASRREKQPLEYPSAGSYFKRPDGYFAGKLIEDCGLKGIRVGGAEVSLKHAGFIINVDGATYSDVLALEEKIKERVYQTYGVSLEREVVLITD